MALSPFADKKCPGCQAILQTNAVICVDCGFDLRTGKKLKTAKAPGAAQQGSSSAEWLCQIDQTEYGPFSSQDLIRMAKTGKLEATDLVKKSGAAKWIPAGKVKGLTFVPVKKREDQAAGGESLGSPSRRADRQPAKATPPLTLAGQGVRVAADADAEIVRVLTHLSRCHEAVAAAEKFSRDPSTALGAGCGFGCATLLAVGIVLGLVLGTPAPENQAARGGVLLLTGAVGGVIAFVAARRRRILLGSANSDEAERLLEEFVAGIIAQFPHVVEAVGGAASLREAITVADVLRRLSRVSGPEGVVVENGYMDVPVPSGDALCSDDSCPCGAVGARIPHGEGCLYISPEVVEFRRDCPTSAQAECKLARMQAHLGGMIFAGAGVFTPILMCEQGARKRGLNLAIAAADARRWWQTGKVPLRVTPMGED